MKIALVLHGSGSLGSYVAGACSELLLALERNRSDEDVVIDVITGSSAGSLTAALAARSLVVNHNLLPWIERCWVEALDARNLSGDDRRDRSGTAGRTAFDEISRGLIASDPASDDEPLPMFGGELRVGLCVVPGSVDFLLTAENGAGDPAWEDMRRAAVEACDFPPVSPSVSMTPAAAPTTGGLLGAPALALAGRLAAATDGSDEERIVVCIDPGVGLSGSNGAGLDDMVVASRSGAGGDARLLDALIARLPEIVDRLDDPGALALGRHLGDLAERAAELESGAGLELDDEQVMDLIDASLGRIEADEHLAPILARASSRSGRTRLAKLIYVLQAACGGSGAGTDSVVMIAPDAPESLACRSLGSLGGFLSQEWRAADFRAGRRDARDAIQTSLAAWIAYQPDEEQAYSSEDVSVNLDPAAQARLRTMVEADVDRALADVRVSGLAGLFGGWRSALKKHTADRVLSSLRDELS